MNLVNMLYIFILIGMFFFVVGGIVEGVKYVFKMDTELDEYATDSDNGSYTPTYTRGGHYYSYQSTDSVRENTHEGSNRRERKRK